MYSSNLHLAISPCPNDTYIFYALIQGIIKTSPYSLTTTLSDIQDLNQLACQGEPDIVKVSVAAYAHIQDNYTLLRSGGALGWGCGPLLVAKEDKDINDLTFSKIAIPGRLTTAYLLLSLHGLHQGEIVEMRYDEIMPAVVSGWVEAGLIIHEGRFTFPQYGLYQVLDLGKWWQEQTGLPIPLGVIVMKRELGEHMALWMEEKIRESLAYAQKNEGEVWWFIQKHAQEMDKQTIQKHIDMFVTDFSLHIEREGVQAVCKLTNAIFK